MPKELSLKHRNDHASNPTTARLMTARGNCTGAGKLGGFGPLRVPVGLEDRDRATTGQGEVLAAAGP